MQLYVPVCGGQGKGFVARVTVKPRRLRHDVLHEPPALATPREGPAAFGQGREGHLEQLVHSRYCRDEVLELKLEHLQRVLQNGLEVGLAESNEF